MFGIGPEGPRPGGMALGRGGPAGGHRPGPDQRSGGHHRRRADGPSGHRAFPGVHGDRRPAASAGPKTMLIASHDPLVYEVARRRPGRRACGTAMIEGAGALILAPRHPRPPGRVRVLISFMVLYAGVVRAGILRRWDIRSGSERPARARAEDLPRSRPSSRTSSASSSSRFFLFIYTADRPQRSFRGRHVRGRHAQRQPLRLSGS